MQRDIMNNLIKWKGSARRKPLIISGVRQCGKTFIIEEFGRTQFTNLVTINFEEQPGLKAVFDFDFDTRRIISEIEKLTGKKIVPGQTLLFLDEIQECPKAITALKYFCEKMKDLHLVCAGSLLGVALRSENISFPVGKVNRLYLYPMSFREFAIASGEGSLIEMLQDWNVDRQVPDYIDVPMKKLLREFYVVGGMPEAVDVWVNTRDYSEVETVQREILKDYADDLSKHAPISELQKIRWIWDSIPVQIAKENNKFVFSHVKEGKRAADLEDALMWLQNAGLIYRLELVEKPQLPLSAFADKTYFKVYMSDIGLMRVRANVSSDTIINESERYVNYKGAFAENYVNNELVVQGKKPYFWRSGNTAEIDFLYEKEDEFYPVEVKSADNTQAKSFKQFCSKYNPKKGIKLSGKNIARNMSGETKAYSIPLYIAWNIDHYI
jgi:predicted AAA+ superfamily ATPase